MGGRGWGDLLWGFVTREQGTGNREQGMPLPRFCRMTDCNCWSVFPGGAMRSSPLQRHGFRRGDPLIAHRIEQLWQTTNSVWGCLEKNDYTATRWRGGQWPPARQIPGILAGRAPHRRPYMTLECMIICLRQPRRIEQLRQIQCAVATIPVPCSLFPELPGNA